MTDDNFDKVRRNYDLSARDYRESTRLPFRVFIDEHTVMQLAAPVEGKSVLDLGCGEGHYARLLKQAGAAAVLGVDLSPEMIALAEAAERDDPLGCRYRVGNAADLALGETFELVVGVYLLNYARTKAQLIDFCSTIARHLAPGGRFVGFNRAMTPDPAHDDDYRKYGLWYRTPDPLTEGAVLNGGTVNADGSEFEFGNYYLRPETYEAAFAEAGLRDFAWVAPTVSEEGRAAFPEGYWDAFLVHPPVTGMKANK